ncbi:MAG: hypothetical protein EZS28_006955 [Streblomastix strix]|uniref:Uncharacterized protein n=1 Tax=Streblomastix strix TaxID=222440 RepID=A0A5J4WSM8_9EUKA|nr:MAG: hypothetical protein EZS28_006955 [Streblomastix strix]
MIQTGIQNRPTSPIRTTPSTRAEGISQIIQTSFPHALRSPTGNYPNSAERHIPTFLTNAWQTNLSQSHLVTTSSTRKNAHEMPGFKRPNQPIANNLEDSKYHPSKQTGTTILSPPRSHSPIHGPFVQKPFCGAPNVIGSGSDQLRALLNSSETTKN